jgi:uncharacterized protein YkwD
VIRRSILTVIVGLVLIFGAWACVTDTSPPPDDDWYANAIFKELNYHRAWEGRPPLEWSPRLAINADNHAWQMAQDGRLYHQNLAAVLGTPEYVNYWTLGENVMVGPMLTPREVVHAFAGSPGHEANQLSYNYNRAGVGWYEHNGREWIAVEFGGLR